MQLNERAQNIFVFCALFGLCTIVLLVLNSCGQENTYRNDAEQQSDLETQQKTQELNLVVGDYCGEMHLIQSKQDFQVRIHLKVGQDNKQSPQSQDPTDIVQVPTLVGSMTFPAVVNQDGPTSSVPALTTAMGDQGSINFVDGDYNSSENQLYLPYTVPGYTGDYGQVNGSLTNGQLVGTWDANSFEDFGSFDLTPCTGSGS